MEAKEAVAQRHHRRVVVAFYPNHKRTCVSFFCLMGAGSCWQRADGRFAVVAAEFDQFVADFGLVFLAGPGVTIALPGQHLGSCALTQVGFPSSVTPLFESTDGFLQPSPSLANNLFESIRSEGV